MTAIEEYMHVVNRDFEIHHWCLQTTKATIFYNLQKVLDFQTKNSHEYIRAVMGLLSWSQTFLYLRPLGVCCHCYEQIWSAKFSNVVHGILLPLKHLAWAFAKWSRQNSILSTIPRVSILIDYGLPEIFVIIWPQVILFSPQKL